MLPIRYGSNAIFTGDHIMQRKRLGKQHREEPMRVGFSPRYGRDPRQQVASVRLLAEAQGVNDFEFMLPGHGRPYRCQAGEFAPVSDTSGIRLLTPRCTASYAS